MNKERKFTRPARPFIVAVLFAALASFKAESQTQTSMPLPGAGQPSGSISNPAGAIPLPGASAVYQSNGDATWVGQKGNSNNPNGIKSLYQFLPVSAEDAKVRIDELKTLILVARPQDIPGRLDNLCEWLADLTEAHTKLANVFSRQDSTKAMAQVEKSAATRFSQLKNEAVLLKAELLIKQNRAPEALAPLVEIVVADPKGTVGQAAYRQLKELGFSQEPTESAGAITQQEHIMVFPQTAKKPAAPIQAAKTNAHPAR